MMPEKNTKTDMRGSTPIIKHMKKIISIILAAAVALPLVACMPQQVEAGDGKRPALRDYVPVPEPAASGGLFEEAVDAVKERPGAAPGDDEEFPLPLPEREEPVVVAVGPDLQVGQGLLDDEFVDEGVVRVGAQNDKIAFAVVPACHGERSARDLQEVGRKFFRGDLEDPLAERDEKFQHGRTPFTFSS